MSVTKACPLCRSFEVSDDGHRCQCLDCGCTALKEYWQDQATDTECVKKAAMYEAIRKLSAQEFSKIWNENIRTGRNFDVMIEELL